jgi:type IV pilus assembly protein PilM
MYKSTAIDFGTSSLKLITHSRISGITKAFAKEIPLGLMDDGLFNNIQDGGRFLRDFLNEGECNDKAFNIAIGGNHLITRQFYLPRMPKKDLPEAVKWEAMEYLPISLDDAVTDFLILNNTNDDDQRIKIFFTAIPKKHILDYFSVFKAAGCDINTIDIPYLAQCRVFSKVIKGETWAIINIGSNYTQISIMEGNHFHSAKTIDKGTEILQQIINMAQNPFSSILKEEYFEEIKRYFDYYVSQSKGKQIDKIQLTGGGMMIEGVPNLFITFNFGQDIVFSVDFPEVFINYKRSNNVIKESHLYTTALGLALGGV